MDDFQPLKKPKLPSERFKAPTSDEDITKICKGFVPPNMQKNNAWAFRLFSKWRAERNKKGPLTSLCPDDLLEPESTNFWLP